MSFEKDQELLTQSLTMLVNDNDAVNAALAVTVDGHLIAGYSSSEHPLKRLATMGSTLMSLGDTITNELKMGYCNNIIAENDNGIVIFMHITDQIVLVTLSDSENSLGMLLSASRAYVEKLKHKV